MTVLKLRFRASTASQLEPGLFLGCRKSKKNHDMIYTIAVGFINPWDFSYIKSIPQFYYFFGKDLLP